MRLLNRIININFEEKQKNLHELVLVNLFNHHYHHLRVHFELNINDREKIKKLSIIPYFREYI
jgi:hypothetical protein